MVLGAAKSLAPAFAMPQVLDGRAVGDDKSSPLDYDHPQVDRIWDCQTGWWF
jgi:hypothetical protein